MESAYSLAVSVPHSLAILRRQTQATGKVCIFSINYIGKIEKHTSNFNYGKQELCICCKLYHLENKVNKKKDYGILSKLGV